MNKSEITELLEYREGYLFWKISLCNRVRSGGKAGYLHKNKYLRVCIKGKQYLVHRIIFFLHHQYWPEQIDHINGNKLDNRIENLRPASGSCNAWNRPEQSTNTSGAKNVEWDKAKNKWRVRIRANNKRIQIGMFEDINTAKQAAIKARNTLHGEFANHGTI
jgi:hypothetical protein